MAENILTTEQQQRIQTILNNINFINNDFSNNLESPLNVEDQKRIEGIMNENINHNEGSSTIISPLQLNLDSTKIERIKRIDQLLEEMKADGHAYVKNITSSKCKTKYTKTLNNLDELKAEMNQIDESLALLRKK